MEEVLKKTKAEENLTAEFTKKVGQKVEEWAANEELCVVAIFPDGIFYARPLYVYLSGRGIKVQYAEIDPEELLSRKGMVLRDCDGMQIDKSQLFGSKVLLVDNDIVSGKTFKAVGEVMQSEADRLGIKDIKYAVFEDRLGLADFAYRLGDEVLVSRLYYEQAKRELLELSPIKEELLQIWRRVPPKYQGEILAILLSQAREWRQWEQEGRISSGRVWTWLKSSLLRASYAYPDIHVPESLKPIGFSKSKEAVP